MTSTAAATTNDNNTMTTTSSTTTTPTCSHPDTVVFGSLAFTIADDLSQTIETSLQTNVSSLPGENDALQLLQSKLTRVYFRNVDVLESYMIRNIFTLDNVSHKKQVLQALLDNSSNNGTTAANVVNSKENTSNSSSTTTISDYDYPTHVPTTQELQDLQQDVLQKRQQLRQARQRRNELLSKLHSLTSAHAAVQNVTRTLASTESPNHTTINKIISSKDALEELQTNATDLNEKLQTTASQRQEEEEDFSPNKKQKLSLEQLYRQQRQATATTQASLSNVSKLLQKE